jgi:hypothetical protein
VQFYTVSKDVFFLIRSGPWMMAEERLVNMRRVQEGL